VGTIGCSSIKTEIERNRYCDINITIPGGDVKSIKQLCPEACRYDCSPSSSSTTPSAYPTKNPTGSLTVSSSIPPTNQPTESSTTTPTNHPAKSPTEGPTEIPTNTPTNQPTNPPVEPLSLKPTPICQDIRASFTITNVGTIGCSSIKTEIERNRYCDINITIPGGDVKSIKQLCPEACRYVCSPSPSPTIVPISPVPTTFICPELSTRNFSEYQERITEIYEGVSGKDVFDSDRDRFNALKFILDQRFCDDPNRMIQRYISALFFFSTGGKNWQEGDTWLTSKHECDWKGLYCNENLVIIKISQDDNTLTGTLPFEICQLPLLKRIDLDNNQIGGTIPKNIGRCKNLEVIDIDSNFITSSFPDSIFDIPKLQVLDVDSNLMTGTLSARFGKLVDLKHLSVYNNKFVGNIPPSIGRIKGLKIAYFDLNNFTGRMPQVICNNRAKENEAGGIIELTADCSGSDPEVACADDCCTSCMNI